MVQFLKIYDNPESQKLVNRHVYRFYLNSTVVKGINLQYQYVG